MIESTAIDCNDKGNDNDENNVLSIRTTRYYTRIKNKKE